MSNFNNRTSMQIGQLVRLAMSWESPEIGVHFMLETRTQDSSEVLQIYFPSVYAKSLFHVRLSGDPTASPFSVADVDATLSFRKMTELIHRIPAKIHFCTVGLTNFTRRRRNLCEKRCFSTIFAYASTDCIQEAVKNNLYYQLNGLKKVCSADKVVLAGYLNPQIGRLSTDRSLLSGQWKHVGFTSDNSYCLLKLCAD